MTVRVAVCVGAALCGLAAAGMAGAATPAPTNDDCLACHGDAALQGSDGRTLAPDLAGFGGSVHGQLGLSCVDCHASLATTTEFPHPEDLPPAQCASCHEGPVKDYGESAHAEALRARPDAPAATCAACHGAHDIRPSNDPASRTDHFNLPRTCGACHGNPETIQRGHIEIGDVVSKFQDSIHGQALAKSGLVVAPNCSSCHGHHDIRRAAEAKSPVFRPNVPATCGRCHAGILPEYRGSVHAAAAAQGGAVCSDCHSAHGIQAAGQPAWRRTVIAECGTCHSESIRTYRDGFHGQASALGFERVATCADCHGAHGIEAVADPGSRVHPANLVATCGRCHPKANANFVKYDPHADPSDRERSRPVHYTARFMNLLLVGVFTFFAVHTALWFPRSWRDRERPLRRDGR
jgi:cytochrome c3-like protein/doubled CXXCH motif protein